MQPNHITIFITLFFINMLLPDAIALGSENYHPKNYAYILQAEALSKNKEKAVQLLKNCDRDLIIIDPFFENDCRWSNKDIEQIRSDFSNRRVIAYLSIGEAEDYRQYWQEDWSNSSNQPTFIEEENPNWAGNYKVRFWDTTWKQIIFAELDKIAAAGFDGVFLDIVDGFEYFENDPEFGYIDNKINPATNNTYRADMIEFVLQIRERFTSNSDKNCLIVPQNGAQLLESQLYQDQISMLALESLFTSDNKAQPIEHTNYILNFVTSLKNYDKTILLTEYPTKKKFLKYSMESSKKYNLVLLQTTRKLNKLGRSDPLTNH